MSALIVSRDVCAFSRVFPDALARSCSPVASGVTRRDQGQSDRLRSPTFLCQHFLPKPQVQLAQLFCTSKIAKQSGAAVSGVLISNSRREWVNVLFKTLRDSKSDPLRAPDQSDLSRLDGCSSAFGAVEKPANLRSDKRSPGPSNRIKEFPKLGCLIGGPYSKGILLLVCFKGSPMFVSPPYPC